MKVYVEGLAANRSYALQARGTGDTETDWSPTYFIKTERDRIAPPEVQSVKIDNGNVISPVTTWYGKDLTVSWDGYAESDESTWDHLRYVVEFVSNTGHSERFYTTDKKFVLSYALNVQRFGGKGCHTFWRVRVWGEDKTGNPTYGQLPWPDGPFVSDDVVYVSPGLNNPPPDKINNVVIDFRTPDLLLSWDVPTGQNAVDLDYVEITMSDGVVSKSFQLDTSTSEWSLKYAENRYWFGGFGSPRLSWTISVLDVFGQRSEYSTGVAINSIPDKVSNVNVNFESPDLLLSWDVPSGPNNMDLEYIEVVISHDSISKSYRTGPTVSKWTFKHQENKYLFGELGSPNLSYSIMVVDVFRQQSTPDSGTAINLPPELSVTNLKSIGVFGGIQVKFDDPKIVPNFHKDAWVTEIYEKPKSPIASTEGDDSLTDYIMIIGTTDNSYDYIPPDYEGPPVVTSFAYRWIRAAYVDVFGQRGPVSKASNVAPSSYPVRMVKPGSFTGYAPEPPTDLTMYNAFDGSFGVPGEVYGTWTPPSDEGLLEYFLEYTSVSMLNADTPSWTSVKIPCDRVYIDSIVSNIIWLQSEHSYAEGDRVSITNVGIAGSVVNRFVVSVGPKRITVDSAVPGAIIDNSFDRGTPGSGVIRSGTALEVMPGTEYRFRIKSGSTGNSSEPSEEFVFKTSGNALVAKKPVEVGTYYDPLDIVNYSASNGTVTITTTQNPTSNGFTPLKIASGMHISVRDSAAEINGRWPVISATSLSVTFQISTALNAATTASVGTITAGTMALGALVDGTNNGLMLDYSNMWASNGIFRVGTNYGTNSWSGIRWEPSEQVFYTSGDIDARSGYFSGNVFLRNYGSLVTGLVLKIDGDRVVERLNASQIKIPVKTTDSIPSFLYAQIISNSVHIDTSGGPATFSSIDNVNKYITVNYAAPVALHNTTINGTIVLDSAIVFGEGGITATNNSGQIKFMLTNSDSGLNRIAGWDITNNAIRSNLSNSSLRSGMSADTSLPSFWAGGNDNSAVWRVNEDGTMYLGSNTVTGNFEIGNAGAANGITIRAGGSGQSIIHSGGLAFHNVNTPFYIASNGQFSIKNEFKIDSTSGTTKVVIGNTNGFQILFDAGASAKLYSGAGNFNNIDSPFYLSTTGQFSIRNEFRIDASSGTTKVVIGNTASQQFLFEASATAKFYQGSGTYGNTNTKIYLDYAGNFSLGSFLKASTTEMLLSPANGGQVKLGYSVIAAFPGWTYDNTNILIGTSSDVTFANSLALTRNNDGGSKNAVIFFPGNADLIRPQISGGVSSLTMSSSPSVILSLNDNYTSLYTGPGALLLQSSTNYVSIGAGTSIGVNAGTSISLSSTADTSIVAWGNATMNAPSGTSTLDGYNSTVHAANTATVSATNVHLWATSREYRFLEWPKNYHGTYTLEMGDYGEICYYYRTSSRKYKKDIVYLSQEDRETLANDVLSLNPVMYSYKSGIGPDTGYIAEDLDDNNINWLVEYSNGVANAISYDRIPLGLVEVAKVHRSQIDSLESTVVQLNERIAQLEGAQ